MRLRLFAIVFFIACFGFATHNRAGYISYCWTGGNNYHIRIFTYTNFTSANSGSDRCDQTVYIDGGQDSVHCYRTNSTDPCPNGGTPPGYDGVIIIPYFSAGNVKLNIYEGDIPLNTGTHILTMIDPNRDANIMNLNNSVNRSFALIDTIAISNIFNCSTNCSVFITNKPVDYACQGVPYCYNPQAVDADNDSLDFTYSLSSEGDPNNSTNVLLMTDETIPGGITVDRHTGILCWNSPTQQGEFILGLKIREYRLNPLDGHRYLVGTTDLDIQILVQGSCSENIAITANEPTTCVVAGTNFIIPVNAVGTGSSLIPPLTLNAAGLPLTSTTIGNPNASFTTPPPSGLTANGTFNWTPSCQAVQINNYYVTIQASDGNSPPYSNYSTFNFKVIAPAPQNVVATSAGSNIIVSWSPPSICTQTSGNKIQKYLIYRNDTCKPFIPLLCQTGVPTGSGYVLIFTTSASVTTFTDTNYGQGFAPGNTYSYLIVAQFSDGSLSIASPTTSTTCVTLKLDIPLITNVSVDSTMPGPPLAEIFVRWKNPNTDIVTGLDTITYHGPYSYILNRKAGIGSFVPVYTVTETYFGELKKLQDTTFKDLIHNIDTQDSQYVYRVDFFVNGGVAHGSSSPASSIFLSAVPHDKKVILSWSVHVPWINSLYYIYKQHYISQSFPNDYYLVDSTSATTYTVDSLTNNYDYCFHVESKGKYSNPNIYSPLLNFSQKVCAHPFDDSPPCQPNLTVAGNCPSSFNTLTWTNPNHTCGINDVVKYYIYYSPVQDSTLTKIDSLLNPNDTIYATDFSSSIAGCYVVVAVDSAGNQSPLNHEACVDNCPEYDLPNIFTPNGDNINDQYIPVRNKYIRNVEFTMYNRWGEIVFETTDPALKWDGKSKQLKQPVSDGTYYYICKVYEIHYYGIKERTLKGFVQIIH